MILAINGVISKAKQIIPSDPDLLSGYTRYVPSNPPFTTTDNKVYNQTSDFNTSVSLNQMFTGDVTILVKFNTALVAGGYGCDLILSKEPNGTDQVDVYFGENNRPTTFVDNGSGGDITGDEIQTSRWYGLRRVGDNIKAVWTTDGITFTTISDFGTRVGYNYLFTYGYDQAVPNPIMPNPQYLMSNGGSGGNEDEVINSILNNRVTAETAKNNAGNTAIVNDQVNSFDAIIGGRNLTWAGSNNFGVGGEAQGNSANVTLSKPKLVVQPGFGSNTFKGVFFENEANMLYRGMESTLPNELRTIAMVVVPSDYKIFEAWINVFQGDYLGNSNGRNSSSTPEMTNIRTLSSGGLTVPGNLISNAPNVFIYRVVEDGQAAPDRVSVKLYLNGTLLNPSTHLSTVRRNQTGTGGSNYAYAETFGATSNVDMMCFLDFGVKYGAITDQQITDLNNAYTSKYNIGQVINAPYATNVNCIRSGDQITVTYDYTHPLGVAENASACVVEWIEYGSTGAIQNGEMITAVNNLKTFNRTTVSGRFLNGRNVRVNVSPVDINGLRMTATRGVCFKTI